MEKALFLLITQTVSRQGGDWREREMRDDGAVVAEENLTVRRAVPV